MVQSTARTSREKDDHALNFDPSKFESSRLHYQNAEKAALTDTAFSAAQTQRFEDPAPLSARAPQVETAAGGLPSHIEAGSPPAQDQAKAAPRDQKHAHVYKLTKEYVSQIQRMKQEKATSKILHDAADLKHTLR